MAQTQFILFLNQLGKLSNNILQHILFRRLSPLGNKKLWCESAEKNPTTPLKDPRRTEPPARGRLPADRRLPRLHLPVSPAGGGRQGMHRARGEAGGGQGAVPGDLQVKTGEVIRSKAG